MLHIELKARFVDIHGCQKVNLNSLKFHCEISQVNWRLGLSVLDWWGEAQKLGSA